MTFADVFIFSFLSFYLAIGLAGGLIQSFGSLLGLFLGVSLAGRWYLNFAPYLFGIFVNNENLAKVMAFFLILFIATRLVGFVFYVIDKVFNLVTSWPFLKGINVLGGGILGIVEGVVTIGAFIFIVSHYSLGNHFDQALSGSLLAQPLLDVFQYFILLLPEGFNYLSNLKSSTL